MGEGTKSRLTKGKSGARNFGNADHEEGAPKGPISAFIMILLILTDMDEYYYD